MNIIKLPQFLNIVDKETKVMSHEELEEFIHEIARKLPERQRNAFIELINQVQKATDIGNTALRTDNGEEIVKEQILNIVPQLLRINEGEVCLDSEYNEE